MKKKKEKEKNHNSDKATGADISPYWWKRWLTKKLSCNFKGENVYWKYFLLFYFFNTIIILFLRSPD